jgi:hypothetical protein
MQPMEPISVQAFYNAAQRLKNPNHIPVDVVWSAVNLSVQMPFLNMYFMEGTEHQLPAIDFVTCTEETIVDERTRSWWRITLCGESLILDYSENATPIFPTIKKQSLPPAALLAVLQTEGSRYDMRIPFHDMLMILREVVNPTASTATKSGLLPLMEPAGTSRASKFEGLV